MTFGILETRLRELKPLILPIHKSNLLNVVYGFFKLNSSIL